MFNKDNKDNKDRNPLNEDLKSLKFHTMKDDLIDKKDDQAISTVENQTDVIPGAKNESPFLDKSFARPRNVEKLNVESRSDEKVDENKKELGGIETVGFSPKSNYVSNYDKSPVGTPNLANQEGGPNNNIFSDSSGFVDLDQGSSSSSMFMYVVLFIFILLLGGGGYYFWMVKDGKTGGFALIQETFENFTNKKSENEIKPVIDGTVPIKDSANNEFSEKTNFLIIGTDELSPEGIKTAIEKKFLDMNKYNGNQLEFLVVDKNNKPITFKDFINGFKISLNSDITDNIELDNFSLFLYKKDSIKRISLVLSVKNKEALKSGLLKNEKTLVSNLNSLFIYDKVENVSDVQFKESNYGENIFRYVNLNKKLDLSVDYSISGDYLILATNKDSGRQIVDKLSEELEKNENIFYPKD